MKTAIHRHCVPISWGYRPIMIIKGMPIQINLSGHKPCPPRLRRSCGSVDGCRRIKKISTAFRVSKLPRRAILIFYCMACNLTKVSLIKSFKGFAVAGFVSCHFMDCVMDCIEVKCFCSLCKVSLSCCCTIFSFDSHFKIFLC